MRLHHWFPNPQKMSDAVQLRSSGFTETTMRQSLGMVVLLGLLAGFVPFLVNWEQAASVGSALPLARLGAQASRLNQPPLENAPALIVSLVQRSGIAPASPALLGDHLQMLAGLDQPLPGWLAAFLSVLGEWINWPLRWLSVWVVYGALVMVCNKALGATVRLQPFFAATGFAAAPLLLIGLSPIPCLGPVSSAAGVIWATIVYARANEEVTGLPRSRSLAAVLLPLLFVFFLSLMAVGLSVLLAILLVTRL